MDAATGVASAHYGEVVNLHLCLHTLLVRSAAGRTEAVNDVSSLAKRPKEGLCLQHGKYNMPSWHHILVQ